MTKNIRKLIDLGWGVATITVNQQNNNNGALIIVTPADYSEGMVIPAQSIYVYGRDNLIALRDALIEVFPVGETE